MQLATEITSERPVAVTQQSSDRYRYWPSVVIKPRYLRANSDRIPTYGERRRAGEAMSTAFTESTVNQVISLRDSP
jgi:hypothetical protein